jgi:hypothetical protein
VSEAGTEDEEEVPFLVLQPYGSHREIVLYPTSRIVRANCGHLCWLSPQGEPMLATAYTICIPCQEATYFPTGDPEDMRTVPGAVEALGALWGDEVADSIREELRRRKITEE